MPIGPVGQAGLDIAQGVIQTGIGMALAPSQDRRQIKQQRKLQQMQIAGSKELTDYQQLKQMEMWKATNYGAQIQQLKEAGLNPGLLYGMGGAGGQSVGAGIAQASGGQAAQPMPIQPMEIGIQNAQRALIEAQTENIKADTANKPIEGEKKTAEVKDITQGIENKKAQEALTKVQTQIADLERRLKGETLNEQIEIIDWTSQRALAELDKIVRENIVDKATMNDRIAMVKTELAIKALMPELLKAQTTTEKGKPAIQQKELQVMQQQWEASILQGVQRWQELELQGLHVNTERAKQEQDAWVNDVQQSSKIPLELIEKVAQAIIFKNILSPAGSEPIKGFHKR